MKLNRLLDLFFPRRCPVCGNLLPFGAEHCSCHSLQNRRVHPPVCEHCGASKEHCTCSLPGELKLGHIAAPFYYTGKVRDELLELKFDGEKKRAAKLSREMALCFAERFANAQPDVVTFVPLSKGSERSRGFNQSALLAEGVEPERPKPSTRLANRTAKPI